MPDPEIAAEADPPEVLRFRSEHAALNRTGNPPPRPAPRLPEGDEPTIQMDHLVAQLRSRLAEEDWETTRLQRRTLPLAGTATVVLVVLILALLLGWLGYLAITRGVL